MPHNIYIYILYIYVHSCPHGNDIYGTPIIFSFIPSGYFDYECILHVEGKRKRISLLIISPAQSVRELWKPCSTLLSAKFENVLSHVPN